MLASAGPAIAFEAVDDLTILALQLRWIAVQNSASPAAFLGTERSRQSADAAATARDTDAGAPRGMRFAIAARIDLAIHDAIGIGAWRKVGRRVATDSAPCTHAAATVARGSGRICGLTRGAGPCRARAGGALALATRNRSAAPRGDR
jgi:hypothetical protein